MKRLVIFGIIAMMITGLSVTANAAMDAVWAVQLRAINTGNLSAGNITLGTTATATDNYTTVGAQDAALGTLTGLPAEIASTIAPRAAKDMRAPVTAIHPVTWDLTMFNNGGAATTITLTAWLAPGTNGAIGGPAGTVKLMNGSEVLWTAPHDVSGTSLLPQFTQTFNFAPDQVMSLQLVAVEVVPEPGSMLALFSGLVGLVGFGIRRRK